MNLQQFQNTVDSLIVLYKHWELLKSENAQCLEAIAILKKDEKMFLAEHDENVKLHFENVELKEQNARLRQALKQISEQNINPWCATVARAALEGKE